MLAHLLAFSAAPNGKDGGGADNVVEERRDETGWALAYTRDRDEKKVAECVPRSRQGAQPSPSSPPSPPPPLLHTRILRF